MCQQLEDGGNIENNEEAEKVLLELAKHLGKLVLIFDRLIILN